MKAIKQLTFFALTLALPALMLVGCMHNKASAERQDDKIITQSIDTALHGSKPYSYPDVKVSARDRVVYLDGAVDYQEQKSRAEKVARSIEGVQGVVNNLAVRQYPTGRAPIITPETP